MTLIEVLVALGIFVILIGTLIPSILGVAATNTRNEQLSVAVRIATNALESYRSQIGNLSSLPTTGTTTTTTTATANTAGAASTGTQQAYTVATTFCPSDVPAAVSCGPRARYIRVTVSYASNVLYTAESYFTELR